MESLFPTKNSIFLDTSFSLTLAVKSDLHHKKAVRISTQLINSQVEILTMQAIVLEIGNSLAKGKYRTIAIDAITRLKVEPNISVVSLTDELIDSAFELFSDRADKEWGLVDCRSFVMMRERRIEIALTADEHFVHAGFRALLREDNI
jgi:predicted nucleic acid-binding protein